MLNPVKKTTIISFLFYYNFSFYKIHSILPQLIVTNILLIITIGTISFYLFHFKTDKILL